MGKIKLDGYKCERCSHIWFPRENAIPRVCPRCKSPYWDVPRGSDKKITEIKLEKVGKIERK